MRHGNLHTSRFVSTLISTLVHDQLYLFLDKLTKQEGEQFGVVRGFVNVFSETLQDTAVISFVSIAKSVLGILTLSRVFLMEIF
jgi:hypothetical protein